MKALKQVAVDDRSLTVAAVDDIGELLIRVDLTLWRDLKTKGWAWLNSNERRDLVLSLVAERATRVAPANSPEGRVITLR